MSDADVLQLIGSGGILAFAVLLFYIGIHAARFSIYGQEALLASSGFLVFVVGMRMVALFDLMSQTDARVANGLVSFAFLGIVTQDVFLHRRSTTS